MKKILIVSILSILVLLVSCNKTSEVEPIGFTYGDIDWSNKSEFFDLEHTSMPSDDQIRSIKNGMSMKDIIYVLGRPHNRGAYMFENISFDWYSENGVICRVSYDVELNDEEMYFESVYKSAEAVRIDIINPLSLSADTTCCVASEDVHISAEKFFDKEQKHTPTFEQTMRVTSEMSLKEIVCLIGKPHNFMNTNSPTLIWSTNDNVTFSVMVEVENPSGGSWDELYREGVAWFPSYQNMD